MKKLLCFGCGLLVATVGVRATPVFSDNFNGYTTGNLAGLTQDALGQGPWRQTGTAAATPIQVNNVSGNNMAALGTSGQDVYAGLPGGPITLADGDNFYIGLTLDVSAAQATGDYFLHFSSPLGTTSFFIDRLFVKSTTGGYLLGWAENSGGAVASYGTSVLSFNTSYRVVVAYHDVAGTLNDTGAVYVSPTDPVEGNNTAYVTKAWTSTTAENETIAALDLRQGSGSAAPTLTVDNLNASTTFSDVTTFTAIPEPTCLSLLGGLGLVALFINRRRS